MGTAEDLLRNVENLAVGVGDVLKTAISTNVSTEPNKTIPRNNMGMYMYMYTLMYYNIYVHILLYECDLACENGLST